MMDVRVASLASCVLAFAVPQLAAAEAVADTVAATGVYQLSGVVTDSARTPVPEVEVTVVEAGEVRRSAVTAADGRFTLGGFPAGQLSLRIRRLGYKQQVLEVRVGARGQPTFVEIVLTSVAQELEEVVVDADPGNRLREFRQRKQQRGTFGRFLEQGDIRRLGATNSSDLFRSVPGIAIRAGSTGGGNTIRIRGCQPMVWVDGQRVLGAELDEVIQPGEIAAIEFYPSSAGVPAQYLERGNRLCGLILVWTKTQ
ncbi:MAG: carboxypeptidase regulatory-like domain-containing protein [Gemmatimonadaceae bacterium]|nr:carboxypeptidase regulatory-like domain-containing protein [Gemmatimonadaceae bacterium]